MASVGSTTTAIPPTIPVAQPASSPAPSSGGQQLPPLFASDFSGRGLASQLGLSTPRNQGDFAAVFAEIASKLRETNNAVDDNQIVAESENRRTGLATASQYFDYLTNLANEIAANQLNIANKSKDIATLSTSLEAAEAQAAPLNAQKASIETALGVARAADPISQSLIDNLEGQLAAVNQQLAPINDNIASLESQIATAQGSIDASNAKIASNAQAIVDAVISLIVFATNFLKDNSAEVARDSFSTTPINDVFDTTLQDAVDDFTDVSDRLVERDFLVDNAATNPGETVAGQLAATVSLVIGALQDFVGPGAVQPKSAFDDPQERVKLAI